jgi:hypothetical protein
MAASWRTNAVIIDAVMASQSAAVEPKHVVMKRPTIGR